METENSDIIDTTKSDNGVKEMETESSETVDITASDNGIKEKPSKASSCIESDSNDSITNSNHKACSNDVNDSNGKEKMSDTNDVASKEMNNVLSEDNDSPLDESSALCNTNQESEGSNSTVHKADVEAMDVDDDSASAGKNKEQDATLAEENESKISETEVVDLDSEVLEEKSADGSTVEETKEDDKENKSKSENKAENQENGSKTEESKKDTEKEKSEHSKGSKGKSSGKKEKKKCAECGKKAKTILRLGFQGKEFIVCSKDCYNKYKEKSIASKPPPPAKPTRPEIEKCVQCQKSIKRGEGYFPVVGEVKALCSEDCVKKYQDRPELREKCSHCKRQIESAYSQLTWETMVFCNEECLGKYMQHLGSHCTCCQSPVQQTSLGKYCVKFGSDIRQFCSGSCLEDFKKNLKVCSFCQTDLSSRSDGFLAPVGDKGQFKDFCSQQCMERYETTNSPKPQSESQECFHCKKQGSFKILVKHEEKQHSLCSDLCIAGFRSTLNVEDNVCAVCFKFHKTDPTLNFKFENSHKTICSKACLNVFLYNNRKITQCAHCKVKKYNFDMIEKVDSNNQTLLFCSLNCLSLYRGNVKATQNALTQKTLTQSISGPKVKCDECGTGSSAQYHLTMSDSTVRNFCTYNCVIKYQNQFTSCSTLTTTTSTRALSSGPKSVLKTTTPVGSPVVANVISRPVTNMGRGGGLIPTSMQRPMSPSLSMTPLPAGSSPIREVIVKPALPKSVKNKAAVCKPIMQTKGISAKFPTCHKAVQTDDRTMPLIVPIPVIYYVPTPVYMYNRPTPVPLPFPVPIPVPIIIDSKKGDLKSELADTTEKIAKEATKLIEDLERTRAKLNNNVDGHENDEEMTNVNDSDEVTITSPSDKDEQCDPVKTSGKRRASESCPESKRPKLDEADETATSLTAIQPDPIVDDAQFSDSDATELKLKVS